MLKESRHHTMHRAISTDSCSCLVACEKKKKKTYTVWGDHCWIMWPWGAESKKAGVKCVKDVISFLTSWPRSLSVALIETLWRRSPLTGERMTKCCMRQSTRPSADAWKEGVLCCRSAQSICKQSLTGSDTRVLWRTRGIICAARRSPHGGVANPKKETAGFQLGKVKRPAEWTDEREVNRREQQGGIIDPTERDEEIVRRMKSENGEVTEWNLAYGLGWSFEEQQVDDAQCSLRRQARNLAHPFSRPSNHFKLDLSVEGSVNILAFRVTLTKNRTRAAASCPEKPQKKTKNSEKKKPQAANNPAPA